MEDSEISRKEAYEKGIEYIVSAIEFFKAGGLSSSEIFGAFEEIKLTYHLVWSKQREEREKNAEEFEQRYKEG